MKNLLFILFFILLTSTYAYGQNLFYKKIYVNDKAPYDGVILTNEAFARIFTLIEPEYCDKKIKIETDKIKIDDQLYLNTIKELHKNELNDQNIFFSGKIKEKEEIIMDKNNKIKYLENENYIKDKIINKYKFKNKILIISLVGAATFFGSYKIYDNFISN